MSAYRFRRRLNMVVTSPGVVSLAALLSLIMIGISPVVCAW